MCVWREGGESVCASQCVCVCVCVCVSVRVRARARVGVCRNVRVCHVCVVCVYLHILCVRVCGGVYVYVCVHAMPVCAYTCARAVYIYPMPAYLQHSADRLAKEGGVLEQEDKQVLYQDENTIVQTLTERKWRQEHPNHNKSDSYYRLHRAD